MVKRGNAWSAVVAVAILASSLVIPKGVSTLQERRVIMAGTAPGTFSPAVVAGGLVYVSGLVGVDPSGEPATPVADVQVETRRVLDRLKDILDAAGSSLAQTVSVTVYLKHPGDFEAMNKVYAEYFVKDLPARTTVVTDLVDGALVQMSAIAAPLSATREVLHPAGWIKSPRPYSYIVRAGGLVFLSGLVSRRGSDDRVVPGSVALQTKTILENAGVLLKTAGLGYEDVVAARVYLTDDSSFVAMNDEYRLFFEHSPPVRAAAVVGLMGADAAVEISFIASTTAKQAIGPVMAPTVPVSTAVRAGARVFVSGVVGNTDTNRDDVAAQAREAFARIGRTLDTAGVSFADVVDSTIYLPDIFQHAKFDDVFRAFFPKDPPARTMAGARLVARDGQAEIVVTAVK